VLIGFIAIRFGLPKFDDHPHVNNAPLSDDHQSIGLKDIFLKSILFKNVAHRDY